MRANYRDFIGDSRLAITNVREVPYPVGHTPFVLRASRPVLLTKGRPKATESTLFVPPTDQAVHALNHSGRTRPGTFDSTAAAATVPHAVVPIPLRGAGQGIVALLDSSKHIDSVRVPFDGESDADDTADPVHYRVAMTDVTQAIPLPDNPLTWTSIAYILWDEVDPELFTPEQERALVDWLHWGGQLIVSGPDSLDSLQNSFLEPYLPATSGGPRTIAADDKSLAELNAGWTISTATIKGEPLKPISAVVGDQARHPPGGQRPARHAATCSPSATSAAAASSFPPCNLPSAI